MALHLTSMTGEKVTPEMLLGTEEQVKLDRMQEAEKLANKRLRQMRKAGLLK